MSKVHSAGKVSRERKEMQGCYLLRGNSTEAIWHTHIANDWFVAFGSALKLALLVV